ncbi:PAS domain S-box protein [Deinococcus knuensis]|uniref:histidine kinase n=1 Tax=Deinococcus knuensis TaxID=1837380 RepID=A0ABQ2SH57_9DEIO|nr:PAS domain S-box protein [Deinococcus knuensis]GGS21943.1 hypothetical protein GCM10008961_11760 [Deinococcus knuensis]
MTRRAPPLLRGWRPRLTLAALAVLTLLTLVTLALTFSRLNNVANLASVSITGWTYSEFTRQTAETRLLVSQGARPADLAVPLAILQSKAVIVTGEPLTGELPPAPRRALLRAAQAVQDLTPDALRTPAGQATLAAVMDGALEGYTGAVATLGLKRSRIASDLRAAEWALGILAVLLAVMSAVAVRQLLTGTLHALKTEVARSEEAEAARAQLERAAAELRAAETNLQRERDFALQVMGAMGEGLYVTGPDDRFEYVNPTLARTLGRSAAELVGQPVGAPLSGAPPSGAVGAERVTAELPLPLPDGRVMPTLLTRVPRGGGGSISVITDLTDIKQAEARLRNLYEVTTDPDDDLPGTLERLLRVGCEAFRGAQGAYVRWNAHGPFVQASVGDVPDPAGLLRCGEQARQVGGACRSDDALAVPVMAGGDLHGALVFHRAPGAPPFGRPDEDFANLIGQWLEQAAERLHAHELLRVSEERNMAIIRSSLDAIITTDRWGVISEFNPAAESIFGFTREQARGQVMADLIVPPHLRAGHVAGLERLRGGGATRIAGKRLELTACRADGEEFPVELSVVPLPTTPVMYAGFVRDITERRAAEERLRERTTQLNSVFNVSPDGFVTFSQAGVIVDVNPAFLDLTGTTHADLLGLREQPFEALLARICDPLRAGDELLHLSRPARRVLKRTTRAMETDSGRTLGRVMYFRDITHEAEISSMKSEFMSTAAHELRTPMTSIYGFAELLLTRQLDPDTTRDLLDTIYRQAGRLILLLTELLDLARIEARAGKDFVIARQDLAPLIRSAAQAFAPPGESGRLTLNLPLLPPVPVDGGKVHQALGNVISNAFKYAPGGEVRIDAAPDPAGTGCVLVTVTDSGIGMTREQAARAFERFYRADHSGSIPGTGLGLSLVQEIMNCHGGSVSLASEPGQGTAVTLRFPLSVHPPPD